MNKLKTLVLGAMLVLGIGLSPVLAPATVGAAVKDQICKGAGGTGANNCGPAGEVRNVSDIFRNIVNILLFLVGAVSVIMVVVGGLRYVTSGGDSSSVNSAKNTIMYAIVGIVVASMAYAIVNFVIVSL